VILEELQKEIDIRSNRLTIQNIVSLFDFSWLDEEDIDNELKELVEKYVTQLNTYIKAKLARHRDNKFNKIYDYNSSSHILEHNYNVSRFRKNETRKTLIENNINYKKYHPKCLTYS